MAITATTRLLHSFPSCPVLHPLPRPSRAVLFGSAVVLKGAFLGCRTDVRQLSSEKTRVNFSVSMVVAGLTENEVVWDVFMSGVAACVALSLLRFWEEMAKLGVEQKLNRKLVHTSVGLVFMIFWPFFSSGSQAPYLAALAPGINIIRMWLMGLGIMKNEALVKSMSRGGDYRELLKGPLYYASTITFATVLLWRTSPLAIAAICNLCAGDGLADIVGRRFGSSKLPYNRDKSYAGSIAMSAAGFATSVMYMHYFSQFGFMEESWSLVLGFLFVSVASAIVESLPISSELDDNLTVPLTSFLVGVCVL